MQIPSHGSGDPVQCGLSLFFQLYLLSLPTSYIPFYEMTLCIMHSALPIAPQYMLGIIILDVPSLKVTQLEKMFLGALNKWKAEKLRVDKRI